MRPSFKLLDDASHSTVTDNLRYATNNIQLAGSSAAIVATNGRELLQAVCPLPWKEDVLIPSSQVFGCKELQQDCIRIGKSDKHVVFQAGLWTLYLPIAEGRFPNVASVIPRREDAAVSCSFDAQDRDFLVRALARLPGGTDENAPITLDLNGHVCIRAKASNQESLMELLLARSQATGAPQRLVMNRNLLARAVHLGFQELHVQDPTKPLLFQDDRRTFVAVPLSGPALAPSDKALRISSTAEPSQEHAPHSQTQHVKRRNQTVKDTHDNEDTVARDGPVNNGNATKGTRPRKVKSAGLAALIDEAETLKSVLRETFVRSKALATALRRHRKQTRLVQSSLKALKELQHIGA